MIDLNDLNPQQRSAVEHTEGPLLVLAGAGSGKTRVLTYRVAYLMQEKGVEPWRILAITFTNKAAREMLERVTSLTGVAGNEVWISTFHACCARILRRDIEKLGYKRSFSIYDEDDCRKVLDIIRKDLNLSEREYPARMVKAVISNAKNRLLDPDEWWKESDQDDRARRYREFYVRYEEALKKNDALDFDDLLVRTLQLLAEHPPVLEYYQNRFQYILVDEYQDTNRAQYELVRALAQKSRNLCVVGDDDQSIYGWRGADIHNILSFEEDFPETFVVKLEQNYRSTGNILDAANQVIAHNAGRKEKALWTEAGEGDTIKLFRAVDERDEASFIAQRAAKLIDEGEAPGQIAVLYRTNAQSRVLEEAFVSRRLPYRVYGGLRFYDRKEVKDLIAYMRAAVNADDDIAVRRIINEPKRGIGESTISLLASHAAREGISLLSAVLDAESAGLSSRSLKQVSAFGELMVELTMDAASMAPGAFLEKVIESTGYVTLLEEAADDESAGRIENIRELQGAVAEYEKNKPEGTLTGFLEEASLMTDQDDQSVHGGAVTLMTLHSAKGLEFDCVFLPCMEEGIFPVNRALVDEDALEEERRLAYVGITRAKKKLFLSCAWSRFLYNQRKENEPSRFLREIPPRLITEGARRGEARPLAPTRSSFVSGSQAGYYSGLGAGSKPKPKVVPSAARAFQPATTFEVGDRVIHRSFGVGQVTAVEGEGRSMRVTVDFGGKARTFDAGVAPLTKMGG